MHTSSRDATRVLAMAPASRGLGFVVLEGAEHLVEFRFKFVNSGNPDTRNKDAASIVAGLIEWFRPDVLVLEKLDSVKRTRAPRTAKLIPILLKHARAAGIVCEQISRSQIRSGFPEAGVRPNRYKIARALTKHYAETSPKCPVKRKIWRGESSWIVVFDALSLGYTYFQFCEYEQAR